MMDKKRRITGEGGRDLDEDDINANNFRDELYGMEGQHRE